MRLALFILFPIIFVGLLVFLIFGLKPPNSIKLAAGINGGGYCQVGQLYKAELARDGIQVVLVETEGSVENIQRLVSGEVDAAFVQGGLELPQDESLQSLGAFFLNRWWCSAESLVQSELMQENGETYALLQDLRRLVLAPPL
ncbi:hypothetical protein GS634_19040 [Ruegeria atlantica]|uniref:TRAP transporter solute receptor, TAXI family n=1 Tax=Ruegeria atlantica TaxID=81569 RepID=A0AA90Z3W7_9RHOB|nr:TAXI family TRAP transporter solute-binding subunit [Ruegeria atlantica]NOE20224.1 hypothetical protein [Ruegeria atlantica]